ncbi:MAG TPA: protein kinase, partial [Polyangiales bacterium]
HGIVHRDLKPSNIFLCSATKHAPEKTKVLDFGIAKLTTPSLDRESLVTQTGVLIGTPYYLSPEQLRNETVDRRTDIYAFGVVLYQLLSGRLPFMSNTFGGLVLQIATGTPVPLCRLADHLPPGVEQVVMRAMARDPAARFQELHELIEALSEFSGQAFARTRPAGPMIAPTLPVDTPLSTETGPVAPAAMSSARATRSPLQVAIALISVFIGAGLVLFFEAKHPAPVPASAAEARPAPLVAAEPPPFVPALDALNETDHAALTDAPIPPTDASLAKSAGDVAATSAKLETPSSPPAQRPKSHPRTKPDSPPADRPHPRGEETQTIQHNPLDMRIQ